MIIVVEIMSYCNKHSFNTREIVTNTTLLCRRQEMEKHKQLLDKEYEQLLTQFSKVNIKCHLL